jgi:hypothetical protein
LAEIRSSIRRVTASWGVSRSKATYSRSRRQR